MTFLDRPEAPEALPADREEVAARAFVRRHFGPWTESDEQELESKLEADAAYAQAFARVQRSWQGVADQATSAELMALRERALSRARRSNSRRWGLAVRPWWRRSDVKAAAVAASLLLLFAVAYQWAPFGLKPGEYRTRVAEQRVIELEDHSRIALDAATRVKVQFSADARTVQLIEGQAQFSVAHDAARPFKVHVGGRTIVALGTKFTVEYIDSEFNLAMLEGRVAVISDASPAGVVGQAPDLSSAPASQVAGSAVRQPGTIELSAGEGLQIPRDGQPKLVKADLKVVTAWREGKVIFNSEPLQEAVRRLNRYSSLRIEITDPALASMRVSGVFDAGDTHAFVEAVQSSLPAVADYSQPSTIRLQQK
jgi:transmembrane sensor